ncbi:hypothetical protein L6164_035063 [Bauhinia variegata]|uniref:Uncharacterized protein n=1 Tax=Bauhinia variegata TaxID=167791 RepID=A0ACB9KXF4_BAUVA|nr:hypothetical protein L6164_035063 [Bauhinia variegata]
MSYQVGIDYPSVFLLECPREEAPGSGSCRVEGPYSDNGTKQLGYRYTPPSHTYTHQPNVHLISPASLARRPLHHLQSNESIQIDKLGNCELKWTPPPPVSRAQDKRVTSKNSIDLVLDKPNVVWTISGENLMTEARPGVTCLGFVDGGLNPRAAIVIGAPQLQEYFMRFDLARSRLGFSSCLLMHGTNCANLNFTSRVIEVQKSNFAESMFNNE